MIIRELIAMLRMKVADGDFETAERKIAGVESSLKRLALVAGASLAGGKLFDWAQEYARYADAKKLFEEAGGDLASLRAQSNGLYSDMQLVTEYNRANKFGLGGAFPLMLRIADASAKLLGTSQEYQLASITKGLSRASVPILDNLGILLSKKKLNAEGVTQAQRGLMQALGLTGPNAQAQADAILQGLQTVELAQRVSANAGDLYDQVNSRLGAVRNSIGKFADVTIRRLMPSLDRFSDWLEKVGENTTALKAFDLLGRAIDGVIHVIAGSAGIVAWLVTLEGAFFSLSFAIVAFTAAVAAWTYPVLALGALLFVVFDEIFALFDNKRLGFFEEWSGKWADLRNALATAPGDGGWKSFFQMLLYGFTYVFEAFDTFFDKLIRTTELVSTITTGGSAEQIRAKYDALMGRRAAQSYVAGEDPVDAYRHRSRLLDAYNTRGGFAPIGIEEQVVTPSVGRDVARISQENTMNVVLNATTSNDKELVELLGAEMRAVQQDMNREIAEEFFDGSLPSQTSDPSNRGQD